MSRQTTIFDIFGMECSATRPDESSCEMGFSAEVGVLQKRVTE